MNGYGCGSEVLRKRMKSNHYQQVVEVIGCTRDQVIENIDTQQ
jgi:hypothetical protein